MTTIAAAPQRPAPMPDREVAASPPEADLPKRQGSDPQGGFGSVLRAAAVPEAARRSGTDARDADAQDDAAGEGRGAQAGAGGASVPAKPDTALLAAALNAALSTAVQAGDAGTGTDAPAAAPGGPEPAARRVAAATGAGAAAPSVAAPSVAAPGTAAPGTATPGSAAPGSATGSGSAPDARVAAGNAAAAGPPPRQPDGSGPGSPPPIQVLDRAAHFAPVRAAAASSGSALAASTPADSASPRAGMADLPVPIADRPRPAGTDGPPGAAGKLEPDQAGLMDQLAAASPGGASPGDASRGRTEPEPQTGDGAARIAATGPGKADLTALADGRALAGTAEARPAPAERRARDGGPDTGIGGRSGTDLALPATAMPAIAAAITEEVQRAAADGPGMRRTADTGVKATPDGLLRTLRIQLRPEELGTVTVELRLAEGRLETHLRAARPETAALLDRDSALLTDLLRQAHAQAEVTVGQARPTEAGSAAGDPRPQGQPAFADGGARPGSGGGGQRQAGQRAAADRRDGERADETVRPRDGGVYL